MKKWITAPVPAGGGEILGEFGELIGGLLLRRGVTSMEKARDFFACGALSDPLLLKDMDKAAEIIRSALDEGKRMTVYGDYDCDGVTATVMLYHYLQAMGAEVDYYIPGRAEGYGMNIPSLERILDSGTELIITVDNGISAASEAEYIKSRGAELVITDHHQPPGQLPVCGACVDPHRPDDNSPFKDLCGAGVVLKLLCALEEDEEFILEQYAELAAVGTVGDVMPLVGENRYIVRRGLENIRSSQNLGLERLLRAAGADPLTATAETLAFSVCPRINAAGRMADAGKAVQLLLADSPQKASLLTEELSVLNGRRKDEEAAIMADIGRLLERDPSVLIQRVITVSGEGWHHGVLGIVAARLLERFGKPVIVIGIENGEGVGSVRGIDGFSVYKLLEGCSELLTRFGGHPKAGGFSLPADRIGEFTARVNELSRLYYPVMPEHTVLADMEPAAGLLTEESVSKIAALEPFGEGNRRPAFLLRDCRVISKRPFKDGKYTGFDAEFGGVTFRAVCFKIPFARFFPAAGDRVDIIASAEINEYNGSRSVELKVQELRPAGFREDRFFAAQRTYEAIIRGEGCDSRLAARVIPDREALKSVYDMLRSRGGASAEDMSVYFGGVNYCMLRIALDAFAEAGMAELSPGAESVKLIPADRRTDLISGGLIARLTEELTASRV